MKLKCSKCRHALSCHCTNNLDMDNLQFDVDCCPVCLKREFLKGTTTGSESVIPTLNKLKAMLESTAERVTRQPLVYESKPTDVAHAIQDILRAAHTIVAFDPDIANKLYETAREAKRALRAVLGDDRLEKDVPVIETDELDHFTDTEQCDEQQNDER